MIKLILLWALASLVNLSVIRWVYIDEVKAGEPIDVKAYLVVITLSLIPVLNLGLTAMIAIAVVTMAIKHMVNNRECAHDLIRKILFIKGD